MKIKGGVFIMSSLKTVTSYLEKSRTPFFIYDVKKHAKVSVKLGYCLVVGIDNALAALRVQPDLCYLVIEGPGPVRGIGLPVLDAYEVKPYYWVKHALPVSLKDYLKEVKIESNTVTRILFTLAKRKLEKQRVLDARESRLAKKKAKAS